MSASVHGQPGQLTLERILQQAFARKRFEWLVSQGADRAFLESMLLQIPFAKNIKPALVQGLDPRAVQKLPSDLDDMASKLERLNVSILSPVYVLPKFPTERWEYSDYADPICTWARQGVQAQKAATFEALPIFLRELSGYLRACFAIQFTSRRHGLRRLSFSERQTALLCLLMHVKQRTGGPSFERVAGLVNAACAVAGTRGISPRRLKSLWKDNSFARLVISTTPGLLPPSPSEKR